MDELFDDLSRIIATPMSRRSTLHLIAGALAARILGLPTSALAQEDLLSLSKLSKTKKLNVSTMAARLRLAYQTRKNYAYRVELFAVFRRLRRADGKELQRILDLLVSDIRKNGADGLETLVLACADGVATRAQGTESSATAKTQLRKSLSALHEGLRFKSAKTPPNMGIPLSRISSSLVLDIRADAARTLLGQLALQNRVGQDVQTIIDLLDASATRDALCDLPVQKNQDDEISDVDQSRTDNCASHNSAGGKGSGTVSGALGDLALSGCLLTPPDVVSELTARLKATNKCMDSLAGPGGEQPHSHLDVGEGLLIAFLISLLAGLVLEGIDVAIEDPAQRQREKNANNAAKDYNGAGEAALKAQDKYFKAVDAVTDKEIEIEQMKKELDTLKAKERGAALTGDAQAQTNLHIDVNAKEREIRDAEGQKRQLEIDAAAAKKESEEAAKTADEKLKKAEAAAKKAHPEDLRPDDPFANPDCRAAFGYLEDRVLEDRIGKNWTDWKSRLIGVSNPDPDRTTPFDALEFPMCGVDDATANNRAAKCNVPVDCPKEALRDENCGCKGTPTYQARLFAKIAADACSDTRCGDTSVSSTTGETAPSKGFARGMVCVCVEPKKDGVPLPPRRPDATSIATLFGNGKTDFQGANNPNMPVVANLFEGLSDSRNRD